MSGKWNVAVILSEKWVVKNKVLLLHYCYWRNGQGHFFIILNFEWFFSKSPHCLCLKINFKLCLSRLLQSGSSHQFSIIGKKINIVSWHIWWRQHLFSLFFSIFGKFPVFFVFHVTLSVLMLKKWNFAVILIQDIRWVVKRLKFVSYCMINCGETGNDIFPKILVFEWLQVDVIFEADGCIKLISPPPPPPHPIVECHIAGQWDVSKERKMTWTLQNHPYIRQLFQELMKWYFQASVGRTYCLLFINQGLTNSVHSVPELCQFILVYPQKFKSLSIIYSFFPIAYRSFSTECPWFCLFFSQHAP